jgi:hypothetical protein
MNELLDSNLPTAEKTVSRLVNEANTVVGACIMTVPWVLSVSTFHITNTPSIQTRLRAKLVAVIPDPTQPLEWVKLESLPYLRACLLEGMRLGLVRNSLTAGGVPDDKVQRMDDSAQDTRLDESA